MPQTGWIIGVLLEEEGDARREYFAVAKSDRAEAEWRAADLALTRGAIATSPSRGAEPIEAVAELSPTLISRFGLKRGEIRALGPRWPRRWLAEAASVQERTQKD